LTLPDFCFPVDEDASKRNIFQIMRERPDIARKAITLRSLGATILDVIGKREVHILSVIPGGIINPLEEKDREVLLQKAQSAWEVAKDALAFGKELFDKNWSDFKKAGDCKTYYMALTKNDALEFYNSTIKLIDPDGDIVSEFSAQDYMEFLEEKSYAWTFAKFAYLKSPGWPKGIVQVGSTARMNVNSRATTEVADREMKDFKRKFGSPTHATLLFDYARLIDLIYACERVQELLMDKDLARTDTRVKVEPKGGRGVGVVEAPRGTLAHEYVLTDEGRLEQMKLVIPTQINNVAINLNLKDAAMGFIHDGEIKPGLLNKIEMVIRAYDPCIKCATRQADGTGRIRLEIRDSQGQIIETV
jgi:F420-non-reducing hydrogenase large subunit